MGRCQQLYPAACRPGQSPGIALGGYLIYCNIVRCHGSENHLHAFFFPAACKHIHPSPLGKPLGEQLPPGIHHRHGILPGKDSAQVPQKRSFPPSGSAKNQRRVPLAATRGHQPLDIPGYPQTKGGNLPEARYIPFLLNHPSAQPHPVPSRKGEKAESRRNGRPGGIVAGPIDAKVQILLGNVFSKAPAPLSKFQPWRCPKAKPQLAQGIPAQAVHVLPHPCRQDTQK